MKINLAIDMMGGDNGLAATAPGVAQAISQHPDLHCLLVGDADRIRTAIKGIEAQERVQIVHASESVDMHESPASALRSKKDSSMRVAINLLAQGQASACVSAGNTGALMATARFVLKTLPGIDRPAIIGALPRPDGHVHVLDLGANVDSPAEILLQFGLMGDSMVRTLEGVQRPTVGLLNVGSEEIKGSETIKQAAELLRTSRLNYIGYVEGDDIFNGSVDIIVSDGFAGNIALKASEGLAQMLIRVMREEFSRGLLSKIAALIAAPVLRSFRDRIDHRRYNGAMLLGLNGAVVKSHGAADELGFHHAIGVARLAAQNDLVSHIRSDLEEFAPVERANA
ncbi:MAG: phosphate acyltransferase [Acidiferrobacteraceae bacterium]|nr:phosphate acyltransferase [Acidiferrobacteraceae bacterium]MCP4829236.1 phosphate acyltransferase PlsX [Pseudomonadota bacterium]MDP6949833.1 phosphate acyltransferase PlsX [Arenicellales bacterium]HJP07674.1 phosphate acyltransferase PlsX [Arenicellales bacterium]